MTAWLQMCIESCMLVQLYSLDAGIGCFGAFVCLLCRHVAPPELAQRSMSHSITAAAQQPAKCLAQHDAAWDITGSVLGVLGLLNPMPNVLHGSQCAHDSACKTRTHV